VLAVLLLLFWSLVLFLGINIILLPFAFTLRSVSSILSVPRQFYLISTNRRLRRNHALEHATINVAEESIGCGKLSGLAKENGFIIRGPADPELIEWAAREGVARLLQGEQGLAIHNGCGTSIASANLLSSVVFLLLLVTLGSLNFFTVLTAVLLASLFGPVLGRLVQRFLTTSTDMRGVRVRRVSWHPIMGGFFGVAGPNLPKEFFVETVHE